MPTNYDEALTQGQARTTNATAADVAGLVFTPADKTAEVYEIEAIAVRENTTNPLVFRHLIHVLVGWSGGAPVLTATFTSVSKIGDPAMLVALVVVAATVKVQVTGIAATTFNWVVNVKRKTLLSN